jgi:hypothetical protein
MGSAIWPCGNQVLVNQPAHLGFLNEPAAAKMNAPNSAGRNPLSDRDRT